MLLERGIHRDKYCDDRQLSPGKRTLQMTTFVKDMRKAIEVYANEIHFFGGSANWEPWQNVCWVIVCNNAVELKENIKLIRKRYNQDSVAVTAGVTEFV